MIHDNISRLACDCLLVMAIVVKNSGTDNRSSRARDARSVARSIRQLVFNFLIDILEGPLQKTKKVVGLVESSAIERLSRSLRIPTGNFSLQYSLKSNLLTVMKNLSDSFIYESTKVHSTDLQLVEKAFSFFTHQLEHSLEQHLKSTTLPKIEDIPIIAELSSLSLDDKQYMISMQTRPASSAISRTRQLSPQKQPVLTVAPSISRSTVSSVCFQCKQSGHFKAKCPQVRCYRCVYSAIPLEKALTSVIGEQSGHYGKDCPQLTSTPQKKRQCKHFPNLSGLFSAD